MLGSTVYTGIMVVSRDQQARATFELSCMTTNIHGALFITMVEPLDLSPWSVRRFLNSQQHYCLM